MKTNANENTAVDMNDQSSVSAERDRLLNQADEMEARLTQLRSENDAAATKPSNAASKGRASAGIKTVKKVVAWTLGVGVVALGSAYLYDKLASAGVEVPLDAVTA